MGYMIIDDLNVYNKVYDSQEEVLKEIYTFYSRKQIDKFNIRFINVKEECSKKSKFVRMIKSEMKYIKNIIKNIKYNLFNR